MAKDTKEKLLEAALKMFSQNGYAGTNIRELSASLGLGKSSLYRHFESKEEIWNQMIDEMEAYYEMHFGSIDNLPSIPDSTDELKELTLRMIDFTVHDEKVIMTRKILLTEQFRDGRICALATKHFSGGLEAIFTKVFEGMMKNGSLKEGDPAMLAFVYTAPISSLVQLCDRETEKRGEALEKVNAFIGHFIKTYGGTQNEQLY